MKTALQTHIYFVVPAILAVVAPSAASAAAFTAGDIVVYRVGSGTGSLASAAASVFADEYTTSGTLVQSIPLPTTASGMDYPLTASGTATSEGMMTLSADGSYLVLPGYGATVGTTKVASSAASAVNRIVGRIDAQGNVDTSTAITDAFSGNNFRGVASDNGTNFWIVGQPGGSSDGGVRYASFGSVGTSTEVNSLSLSSSNLVSAAIFGGQLYEANASKLAGGKIQQVGTNLPTVAGSSVLSLLGTGGSSYQFYMATLKPGDSSPDTLYLADDSAGILKYCLDDGTWTAYGSATAASVRGLTGMVSGNDVDLFGSTSGVSGTTGSLYSFVDSSGYDGALTGAAAVIATAPANEAFRGVAFVPVPEPATWAICGASFAIAALGGIARRRRKFSRRSARSSAR